MFGEERVDALFTPTTPTPAFKAGDKVDDPVAMYLADIFVCTVNLARVPALSVPIGRTGGLPIGGQLIGPDFSEARLVSIAGTIESLVDGAAEVA